MVCPKCKYQNLHGANFCEKCGLDLKAAAKAAANPMASPYPGGGYSPLAYTPAASSTDYSSYSQYTPAPKPTAAPPPVPAHRLHQNQPAARQATPPPEPKPSQPAQNPPALPRRHHSQPTNIDPSPPRPQEPPAFGYLTLADTNTEFPLRYDDNLIGRSSPREGINPAVDLTAADTSGSVSRRHARIGKDDSSIYVEDLGSSNGSRHNGQLLHKGMQAPVADGDELIFGSLKMRFRKA